MTVNDQMARPRVPSRAAEPARNAPPPGNRPLPRGVVGLAQAERGTSGSPAAAAPSGTLLVGQGIEIKGAIEACKCLTVEGRVEASIQGERLEVLAGGRFVGTAEVDQAAIAGSFEGTLVVRGHLAIAASGAAKGKVRFKKISIETGGRISGDVDTLERIRIDVGDSEESMIATGG